MTDTPVTFFDKNIGKWKAATTETKEIRIFFVSVVAAFYFPMFVLKSEKGMPVFSIQKFYEAVDEAIASDTKKLVSAFLDLSDGGNPCFLLLFFLSL